MCCTATTYLLKWVMSNDESGAIKMSKIVVTFHFVDDDGRRSKEICLFSGGSSLDDVMSAGGKMTHVGRSLKSMDIEFLTADYTKPL